MKYLITVKHPNISETPYAATPASYSAELDGVEEIAQVIEQLLYDSDGQPIEAGAEIVIRRMT